jgi:Dolichyl-phosphate-mannose-protein mannosyltransferase
MTRQPFAGRPVAGVMITLAAVLTWAGSRYGYHRDELYFLACGRHLAWGYPDQPPLVPFLARLADLAAPGSTIVLRVPAVSAAITVVVTAAALAHRFGGGSFAQVVAAVTTATGAVVLLGGHLLSTATIDLAIWTLLSYVVVRLLDSGDRRWWLAFGAVLGVGLLNKQLPIVLAAGVVAGMLLTPSARPLLSGPLPWAGGLIAALCWTPVLVWQARHGWPQATLAGRIHDEYGTPDERIGFVVAQILLFGLVGGVLWLLGLKRLWGNRDALRWRPLAVAWAVVLVVFLVTAGQAYYPAGSYPALIAAGAVVVERWGSRARPALLAAVATSAALVAPAVLPVLSPSTLDTSPWSGLAEAQLETVGWPSFVDQVASAYRSVPVPDRRNAVVFTGNYGEAGAIEEYGPERELPPDAYSGHNGFADWGPPSSGSDDPVVVVEEGLRPDIAPENFTGCRFFSTVETGVRNEEGTSARIWVCAGVQGGWVRAWPRLRHLSP